MNYAEVINASGAPTRREQTIVSYRMHAHVPQHRETYIPTEMWYSKPIVHSRSVDPRKLCIGVKYYILHMYSMPYYTYGSTANFLVLEPTALIYYIKRMTL